MFNIASPILHNTNGISKGNIPEIWKGFESENCPKLEEKDRLVVKHRLYVLDQYTLE